jgi:hypothetical protein
MAVTIAAVIKSVCLSRRQKAEHVTYRTPVQTPACFALLIAPKPNQAPICSVCPEPDQHRNLTSKIRSHQTMSK